MSSHREAPEVSKDPVADNTDVYAFVSPDRPDTVTLIANFIPLQHPDGGPNFYEFGDDVLYEIKVSNSGDAQPDVTYQFRFTTRVKNANTFLYNTGPIKNIGDATFNRPQTYSVVRVARGHQPQRLATRLAVPPVNIGPRSTPSYASLAAQGVHALPGGRTVFAGQRADGFWVDLGSVFDLGTLRPFQHLHLIPMADAPGVNGLQDSNVHTIAIQVPKSDLARGGHTPTSVGDAGSVIGVWATASRQRSKVYDSDGHPDSFGPFQQVSRLGNPLVNEVLIPMASKDRWNAQTPHGDSAFAKYVSRPELAGLLAILLTGMPTGVVSGFQNFTGSTQADMLRLNLAVPPSSKPNPLGLVGGDAAGFPNGRRLTDDVVTIELRAVAGLTIPLVDKSFTPDAATSAITDGTHNTNAAFLGHFPYLGTPAGGFQSRPGTP